MYTTQILISEEKFFALKKLAHQTGSSESELITQAIDEMLKNAPSRNFLENIQQAKGLWKDHDSISAKTLRDQWDRI